MLPTVRDISPTNCADLDERFAVERFFGADLIDAVQLFEENPLFAIDDLVHMGTKGYLFYFDSFRSCLLAGKMDGSGVLASFSLLARRKLQEQLPQEHVLKMISCIDYVLSHENAFSDGGRSDLKAMDRLRAIGSLFKDRLRKK